MARGIAGSRDDAGAAFLIDAEKSLRLHRGLDGVDRGAEGAGRRVLESDGHREATRHLPVSLRLGGARADGAPAGKVRDVLRSDGVEHLRGSGQAEVEDL